MARAARRSSRWRTAGLADDRKRRRADGVGDAEHVARAWLRQP
jgi:hypothetical protein